MVNERTIRPRSGWIPLLVLLSAPLLIVLAMVSNLLVVLCSGGHTQPVVNTGSLYS
jgi:hypothetical protein